MNYLYWGSCKMAKLVEGKLNLMPEDSLGKTKCAQALRVVWTISLKE
jgi:hypothetical protein